MPTVEDLRKRFIEKLKEMFRLDQPDLDFGFFRIMHANASRVQEFLENDLVQTVSDVIADFDEAERHELELTLAEALETARNWGAPKPEEAQKVKEIQAKIDSFDEQRRVEVEIYDHLNRFFERYYERGDFLSRRYYARETSSRASPFAIPYNGEEVKLHWANADQYYIKSSDYFSNCTFDLWHAKELRQEGIALRGLETDEAPLKVHFRVVEATEGEHGNIKATIDQKRYFVLHKQRPVELTSDGELCVNFEYRPDPEKSGQETRWRKQRNIESVAQIFASLEKLASETKEPARRVTEYLRVLRTALPTDTNADRTLLSKYVDQYTERNTADYFIHKDLENFLRRELDFYIKNEVLILDHIVGSESVHIKRSIVKIELIRTIALKIIEFLSQLESFQKNLWMKKKFVVETNYCLTLDRVPQELYSEIANNEKQCEEWIHNFAIDEIQSSSETAAFTNPLTLAFLRRNQGLILDTRWFSESFKTRLLASYVDIEAECEGLLVHSENFQALNLLRNRYREQVNCAYTDPPYNTNASQILYKNGYKHSSWLSLLKDRIHAARYLLRSDGIAQIAIDDTEFHRLRSVVGEVHGDTNHIANIVVMHNPSGRDQSHIADSHEYTIIVAKDIESVKTNRLKLPEKELKLKYPKEGKTGRYKEIPLRRSGSGAQREDRPFMYFPFVHDPRTNELSVVTSEEYNNIYVSNRFNDEYVETLEKEYLAKGFKFILPIREDGSRGRWRLGYPASKEGAESGNLFMKETSPPTIYQKKYANETYLPKSLWVGERFDASSKGTNLLKSMLPNNDFDYPKSIGAVEDMLRIGSSAGGLILDYFAGSGTTAHAVLNLNREAEPRSHQRRYILIEMGDHFDTVLKPRIKKAVYSPEWKSGKPVSRESNMSHFFKCIRLESYEDTLNNIEFDSNEVRLRLLESNPSLREDYMLRYWLHEESQKSQSLLNIDRFTDPTSYGMKIKKSGSDELTTRTIDLIETFNYLIGLRVRRMSIPQSFTASFEKVPDPDIPNDRNQRLALKEDIHSDEDGQYWFRAIEGWVPRDVSSPDN
ncbi:MAG: site-specific DNA-methyltransferase, partial [Gammaproteobacteria bacterium]|nr:site-specific DNA-methyltransferase [Gammaproteobacteria bacterium]